MLGSVYLVYTSGTTTKVVSVRLASPSLVRIDYNTEAGGRGRYARIAVTLDLAAPLTSRIKVDGVSHVVEYENTCLCYGHHKVNCPEVSRAKGK